MTASRHVLRSGSDRAAGCLSLVDLRMRRINAALLLPTFTAPLTAAVSVARSMSLAGGHVIYDVTYALSGSDAADRRVFEAELTLNLLFRVNADVVPDEEDLRVFGAVGVLEIAHPYFREVAHALSGRMGLPPLVLEVSPPLV